MEVIGRVREISRLNTLLGSSKSEFVAIYGRRRVGKTYLIRNVYKDHIVFYHTGLSKGGLNVQLNNFVVTLEEYNPNNVQLNPIHNWVTAFQALKKIITASKKTKKVIFLDEIPWMDTPNSGFISALEHFWNTWLSTRKDILFIVCGSATSWIMDHLINSPGGLHNRITQTIKLNPFSLKECEQFFSSKHAHFTHYQLLELYMSLGGIPYYLEKIDGSLSIVQNINNLFFTEGGALVNEYHNIYRSLFKKPEKYIAVIEALANKTKGLSRDALLKAAKLANGGTATKILTELEESGFIRAYRSIGKKSKDQLFQLIDMFSLFYHKFLKAGASRDQDKWLQLIDHPVHRTWSGYAFEMLCLHHIQEIKAALGIEGILTDTAAWNGKSAQIDLVIDRRDQVINLIEMKFSINQFKINKKYSEELMNKISAFREETKTKKALNLVMLTPYGVENPYYYHFVTKDFKMDIFFKPS